MIGMGVRHRTPQVKLALCQLLVTADKDKNIKTAQEAIKVSAEPARIGIGCSAPRDAGTHDRLFSACAFAGRSSEWRSAGRSA